MRPTLEAVLQPLFFLFVYLPFSSETPTSVLLLSTHIPASIGWYLFVAGECRVPVPYLSFAIHWYPPHNLPFLSDEDARIALSEVSDSTLPARHATGASDYLLSESSPPAPLLLFPLPCEVAASAPPASPQSPISGQRFVPAEYSQTYGNQPPDYRTVNDIFLSHPHTLLSVPPSFPAPVPIPDSVILHETPAGSFHQSATVHNANVYRVSVSANHWSHRYP